MCVEFNDNDDVIELPCNHLFTPESIKKWLSEESNECPVCRYSFKSKEIKNENSPSQTSPRRRRALNTMFPNLYHNPMQRYCITMQMGPFSEFLDDTAFWNNVRAHVLQVENSGVVVSRRG